MAPGRYHDRMDTSPTRLLIHGASGRMGQALLLLAAEQPACTVVAAVTRRAPAQRVVDGVPHFAATELGGVPAFDAAVEQIAHITAHLLEDLSTTAPAKDREVEAAKARARNAARFGTPA